MLHFMMLPLRRYFDFRGASGRKEFWHFLLLSLLAGMAARAIDLALGASGLVSSEAVSVFDTSFSAGPAEYVTFVGLFMPWISLLIRRLHDIRRSGWWVLLYFIPIVGFVLLIVLALKRGTRAADHS